MPDIGMQGAVVGQRQLDQRRLPVRLTQQPQRQRVWIKHRVGLLLPSGSVQRLGEVPGLIEQPDPDDRNSQIRCGFKVVTSENSKATGVLRQYLSDPELGAEVRDGFRNAFGLLRRPVLVPARIGLVRTQPQGRLLHSLDELFVVGQCIQLRGRQGGQEGDWITIDAFPKHRCSRGEQLPGGRVPRPAKVDGELVQVTDRSGQDGAHVKPTYGLHAVSIGERKAYECHTIRRSRGGQRAS